MRLEAIKRRWDISRCAPLHSLRILGFLNLDIWQRKEGNLAVDDIALLYEEQVPRSEWQVGRVVEVYLETHGRVR